MMLCSLIILHSCTKNESNEILKPKPSFDWQDTVIRVVAYEGSSYMAFETAEVWENTQEYLVLS